MPCCSVRQEISPKDEVQSVNRRTDVVGKRHLRGLQLVAREVFDNVEKIMWACVL